MTKVGVLGSGVVGQTLADGFLKHGHDVMRGSREPEKLASWKAGAGASASVGTFEEAARFADVVVLAVKGTAAESVVDLAGIENLAGKTVLDTTNPIGDGGPVAGVVPFFTGPNDSLMERLQKRAPRARFVKCFSCVGAYVMVDPKFDAGRPTMFVCGDDEAAKGETRALLDAFGWDCEDMGSSVSARAIEPLCQLWCIPGFLSNQWTHAFKLLR